MELGMLLSCSASTADPSHCVFVTVPHSCSKNTLRSTRVASHWRGPYLLNIDVLPLTFGVPSLISLVVSVDVKHRVHSLAYGLSGLYGGSEGTSGFQLTLQGKSWQ